MSRWMVLRETDPIRSSRSLALSETYSTRASGVILCPLLNLLRIRAIRFNGNNFAIAGIFYCLP